MKIDRCHKSIHWNERKNGGKPEMVVIHHTSKNNMDEVWEAFFDRNHEISTHYLIDRDGSIYQLVDEDKRAYHSGWSTWSMNGKTYSYRDADNDVNSVSIGIELFGRFEWEYTPEQIAAVEWMCLDIRERYKNIKPEDIVLHACMDHSRKNDPGPNYPYELLARKGAGVYPDVSRLEGRFNEVAQLVNDEVTLTKLFNNIGYNTRDFGNYIGQGKSVFDEPASFKTVVRAFQYHYESDDFNKDGSLKKSSCIKEVGIPTIKTVLNLVALNEGKLIQVENEPIIESAYPQEIKRVAGVWG